MTINTNETLDESKLNFDMGSCWRPGVRKGYGRISGMNQSYKMASGRRTCGFHTSKTNSSTRTSLRILHRIYYQSFRRAGVTHWFIRRPCVHRAINVIRIEFIVIGRIHKPYLHQNQEIVLWLRTTRGDWQNWRSHEEYERVESWTWGRRKNGKAAWTVSRSGWRTMSEARTENHTTDLSRDRWHWRSPYTRVAIGPHRLRFSHPRCVVAFGIVKVET